MTQNSRRIGRKILRMGWRVQFTILLEEHSIKRKLITPTNKLPQEHAKILSAIWLPKHTNFVAALIVWPIA